MVITNTMRTWAENVNEHPKDCLLKAISLSYTKKHSQMLDQHLAVTPETKIHAWNMRRGWEKWP